MFSSQQHILCLQSFFNQSETNFREDITVRRSTRLDEGGYDRIKDGLDAVHLHEIALGRRHVHPDVDAGETSKVDSPNHRQGDCEDDGQDAVPP